ncbi:MAG TPA: NAD(P)/FAD-dependent oxidoreductase [Pyrinomonadaceae bacterium]|nr:NAD(P)/FAD-dependent oxidoreductase [Pyrinomonadaceae bacterium]
MSQTNLDAIVVGAGPNGLSAAIELARAGLSVRVFEAKETIGGGARTAELIEPGFLHDICSAIHPIGVVSPFFQTLPLERWGVEWVEPPVALAHPFDDGTAALMHKSLEETARTLGPDGAADTRLLRPFVERADDFIEEILQPIRLPRHPFLMARFGLKGLRSCTGLARATFREHRARAMFAGCAAHSVLPLDKFGTASFGLVLALAAHAIGWPCARRGSQSIVDALAEALRSLGGEIETSRPVNSMRDLPDARAVLFDLTPRQVVEIAGDELPARYSRRLSRFRYGPGVFKIDWTLDGPVPWKAKECALSATVHLGGTIEEIARGEDEMWRGRHPERPFVLFAQQSLFDPTRAPEGKQTGWAYCHVPHGSEVDMTEAIERQVERFAPGFRDLVRGRHTYNSRQLERHNPNMIGGDIGGGANDLRQFMARPLARYDPYSTPNRRLYICSSSTPPGGGVHGMCGHWAARSALRRVFGLRLQKMA